MTAQEMMNEMMDAGKFAVESYKQLGQITQRAFERVNAQHMAVAREYLEMGTRYVSLLANARDVRALVNDQAGFAKEIGEKMLANADTYAKLAQEAQGEFVQWAEKATKTAVAEAEENVKKAVKKAA
jgi:hypothetical protein